MSAFPTVVWGAARATFQPAATPPPPDTPIQAALVFACYDTRFVVADIAGRGWCIPGGRLEPGETPEQAAQREAWEECGATLGPLCLLGHYLLTEVADGKTTLVPTYRATVLRLDPLPSHTEARGVRLMAAEELPTHYFLWDPLIAAVFAYAQAAKTE